MITLKGVIIFHPKRICDFCCFCIVVYLVATTHYAIAQSETAIPQDELIIAIPLADISNMQTTENTSISTTKTITAVSTSISQSVALPISTTLQVTTVQTTTSPVTTSQTTMLQTTTSQQIIQKVSTPRVPLPPTPEYEIVGLMQVMNEKTLYAPRTGKIAHIFVKKNKFFEKGDLLFEFDCAALRTEIEAARLIHKEAKIKRKHIIDTIKSGEKMREELELARLQVEIALNKLNYLRKDSDSCYLEAPFSGSLHKLHVNAGSNVDFLTPLVDIASAQLPYFVLEVPVKWLKWLKVGKSFVIKVDALDKKYVATVTELAKQVNAISQTLTAKASLEEPDSHFRIGMQGLAIFKPEDSD